MVATFPSKIFLAIIPPSQSAPGTVWCSPLPLHSGEVGQNSVVVKRTLSVTKPWRCMSQSLFFFISEAILEKFRVNKVIFKLDLIFKKWLSVLFK